MEKTLVSPTTLIPLLIIISRFMSIVGEVKTWNPSLPYEILSLDFAARLSFSSDSVAAVSGDFGGMVTGAPAAVLYPATAGDVVELIEFSYNSSSPFAVAARGHGHSARGQATATDGVVVDMRSLKRNGGGIRVSWSEALGFYADVGGHELWVDVLRASLEYGLAPVSWTDYLYLTVGGTLSNAGISGQTFRYGPQIANVLEMDVITGKGEFITCSKHINSELFFAVLGGLGQFGVITRARIVLNKAPTRVKWVRMLYDDFTKFTRDQEHLISIDDGLDYVEGSLVMNQSPANNWRSSFFSPSHQPQIASLISNHGIIYSLEVVKYYDDETAPTIDEELQELFKGLSFIPGFVFEKDVSFFDFLNRVRSGEVKLRQKGLWDVPHPWLNLFVPKSRILDFNVGVFVDIILRQNKTSGPILVYPTNKSRWDDRMSAVIPEEETFYCVGLLHSSGVNEWGELDSQNEEILKYCDEAGIKIKQYLPHYKTEEDWENHFGKKWKTFQQRKALFDPKLILSPGQRIFS
nr:cytokinin dehydrogenase 3 [Ipomoea trifida]